MSYDYIICGGEALWHEYVFKQISRAMASKLSEEEFMG